MKLNGSVHVPYVSRLKSQRRGGMRDGADVIVCPDKQKHYNGSVNLVCDVKSTAHDAAALSTVSQCLDLWLGHSQLQMFAGYVQL